MTKELPTVIRSPRLNVSVRKLQVAGIVPVRADTSAGTSANAHMTPVPVAPAEPTALPSEEALREALHKGFETGREKGLASSVAEMQGKVTQINQLIASISHKRDDLLEVLEDDLVELVFEAVGHVVGSPDVQRDMITAAVRTQLATKAESQVLTVRIAPEDYDLFSMGGDSNPLGLGDRITLVADPDVGIGGCVIDTGRGTLDARLEHRLESLRRALVEGRRRAPVEEQGP